VAVARECHQGSSARTPREQGEKAPDRPVPVALRKAVLHGLGLSSDDARAAFQLRRAREPEQHVLGSR
jgi:hypothetical protein